MAKNAAKLAGLAALAGAAYLFSKKKKESEGDDTGSTRKARSDSTETRDENYSNEGRNKPPVTSPVKTATRAPAPKAGSDDMDEDYGNEGRRTSFTPSSRATPGGDVKRTEGGAPMPSLRAVERKVAARQASKATDAMRNASRANVAAANKMKRMAANPEAQAVESVYPEEYVVGGPGLKAVGAAAKNLANRGSQKLAEYSTPLLRGPAAEATAPRLGAPAKQLTGPSKADLVARDRAARAAAREESMRAENAANYGLNPEAPGYGASASALRDKLGGADFSLGMKRGGAVKAKRMASGGMTSKGSSASRRGDGIASRGKTRGKLY
jgi:hypothetical protein